MHFRFRGNPNTNSAGRLFQFNQRRTAAGLPPLTLAEFEGRSPRPEGQGRPLLEAARFLPPARRKKQPPTLF